MARKKQVVFVSNKNACRSIIAQAYMLKHGFEVADAQSFGIIPDRIHYLVAEILKEKGFNLNFYFSKAFEVVSNQKFDTVVLMHPGLKGQLPKIKYDYELIEWEFEDPTAKELSEAEMRDAIAGLCSGIEDAVRKFLEKIL
jgi:protein-tyrosine-phosphatase